MNAMFGWDRLHGGRSGHRTEHRLVDLAIYTNSARAAVGLIIYILAQGAWDI